MSLSSGMTQEAACVAVNEPSRDCGLCPRLKAFREDNRVAYPDFFNAPVPGFGDMGAPLMICGLAPGLKGANRTGRPFTGDFAGDLLYETLLEFGFAEGDYQGHAGDGIVLKNCRIVNAVRCVPPQNKPVGAEINTCNIFLGEELADPATRPKIVLALGGIAHNAVLKAMGIKQAAHKFGHAAKHDLGTFTMVDSYHCSRYNTNTGRLTTEMFHDVFRMLRALV